MKWILPVLVIGLLVGCVGPQKLAEVLYTGPISKIEITGEPRYGLYSSAVIIADSGEKFFCLNVQLPEKFTPHSDYQLTKVYRYKTEAMVFFDQAFILKALRAS